MSYDFVKIDFGSGWHDGCTTPSVQNLRVQKIDEMMYEKFQVQVHFIGSLALAPLLDVLGGT